MRRANHPTLENTRQWSQQRPTAARRNFVRLTKSGPVRRGGFDHRSDERVAMVIRCQGGGDQSPGGSRERLFSRGEPSHENCVKTSQCGIEPGGGIRGCVPDHGWRDRHFGGESQYRGDGISCRTPRYTDATFVCGALDNSLKFCNSLQCKG